MDILKHWHLLPSFLAVMEHGSLLAASRVLGVHQPTVGRHIAEMEAHLGRPLFERTGRGLRPTATALGLLESARRMRDAGDEFMRLASQADTRLAGTVRVTASEPVACYLLPPLVATLREAHPEIVVALVVENRLSNLLAREADIAVRLVNPNQQSLIARRVGTIGIGLYAHRDYLRRHGAPRTASELVAHRLIGFDRSNEIERGLENAGISETAVRFAFRTDHLIAYWQAVRSGLGLGFVADYVAITDPNAVRVLPDLPIPARPLWLVAHRELRGSRRIRAVFDHLATGLPGALGATAPTPKKERPARGGP
jgi:DNA-binding transcriptional LysR family regulator